MIKKNISEIINVAAMIVGGYAFAHADDGNVRAVDIHEPFHAAVISTDDEVIETDMDGIELSIVMDYWLRNRKYMEETAYA